MQNDSDKAVIKLTAQIEQLKKLNLETVDKCEDLKQQIVKMKKQHAIDMKQKLEKASKHSDEVEAEIQVLKEMIKSVKLQVKSKDTDIQRLNIKIKRLEKTAEIRENVINESLKNRGAEPVNRNHTNSQVSGPR